MGLKRQARHHSCDKGKRVRILLASGEIVEGKFIESKARNVFLDVNGIIVKIKMSEMMTFGINRKPKGYNDMCCL